MHNPLQVLQRRLLGARAFTMSFVAVIRAVRRLSASRVSAKAGILAGFGDGPAAHGVVQLKKRNHAGGRRGLF